LVGGVLRHASSVHDRTDELLAILDPASAESFARRLLWALVVRRFVVALTPIVIVALQLLR